MRFADFHVGQKLQAGPRPVSQQEVLDFARAWDPQWFHTDPEAAAQGRFGGLIASGWHTCAIAMRMAVDAALHDSESLASPGLDHVKWPHPVRPGDALTWQAEVLSVRRSRSTPTLGILQWRWQLLNQHGTEVLDLQATSLFQCLDAGGTAAASG